jgi:hypothetical protein
VISLSLSLSLSPATKKRQLLINPKAGHHQELSVGTFLLDSPVSKTVKTIFVVQATQSVVFVIVV